MTLFNKIKLVDELIQENPDLIISEYLFALEEIENIEKSSDMPTRINSPNLNLDQKALILKLSAEKKPAKEIAAIVGVTLTVVYKTCQRAGKSIREIQYPDVLGSRGPVAEEVKNKIVRPPAEYSNRSAFGIATECHNQKAAS